MKMHSKIGRAVLIALFTITTGAMAAGGTGKDTTKRNGEMKKNGGTMKGKNGNGAAYNQMFDPSTMETVRGSITKVDSIMPGTGMDNIVTVKVKTNGDTMDVHLAPASFLADKNITPRMRQQIETTGSRTVFQGDTVLIASKVKINGKEVELRSQDGQPKWMMNRQ